MRLNYSDTKPMEGFAPQLIRVIFHNSQAAPGEGFKVDLHMQNIGDEPAQKDYWLFVHFRPEDDLEEPYSSEGFAWDFCPAKDTSLWQTAFVVKEEGCYFRVPSHIKPGRYTVMVGLFDHDGDLSRSPFQNKTRDVGGYRYRAGQVQVVEEAGLPPKVLAYRLIWRVREPRLETEVREPVYVTHGKLGVGFDLTVPSIRGWRYNGEDLLLGGDPTLSGVEADFVSLEDKRHRTSLAVGVDWVYQCRISGDVALYKCRLRWRGAEVARFDLRFQVDRSCLRVRMGSVQEAPGYHLVSVTLPSIVSIAENIPGAALAFSNMGGRLVDISSSGRHRQVHGITVLDPIPGGLVVSQRAVASTWVKSVDDRLVSEVLEAGPKHGSLGVRFSHRVRADNTDLEFVAKKTSEFEVTLVTQQQEEPLTWVSGAPLLSKYFRARPNPLYINSLMYKLSFQNTHQDTLRAILEFVQKVYHLTDGAKQIVYLAGPLVREKKDCEALEDLVESARDCNAIIGVSDPGDAAESRDTAAWDGSGNSLVNLAGLSVISPKRAVEDGLFARVAGNLAHSGITQTVQLARFTSKASRYDHHPDVQAGAEENLAASRQIIDTFGNAGLDPTGGDLTAPFAGPITHFWYIETGQAGGNYTSETPIPLVPMVLHGKVTYGTGFDERYGDWLLHLYGCAVSEDWEVNTSAQTITDRYYLITLPWSKLAVKSIVDYQANGAQKTVTYEDGDTVEVNAETGDYCITSGGYVLGRNFVSTVPVGRHSIYVYSKDAGLVRVPLPTGWGTPDSLRVETLIEDGSRTTMEYRIAGGGIEIVAPAGLPIIVSKR